jgi:glycogen debranching enzyme
MGPSGAAAEGGLQVESATFYFPDARGLLPDASGPFGLYHLDTRYLSCLEIRVDAAAAVPHGRGLAAGAATLRWRTLVTDGCLFGRLDVRAGESAAELQFTFGADFRDIFEVRGVHPPLARQPAPGDRGGDRCVFAVAGRDGVVRQTWVRMAPPPDGWEARGPQVTACYRLRGLRRVEVVVVPTARPCRLPQPDYRAAADRRRRRREAWARGCTRIRCSDPGLQGVLDRASANLCDLWWGDSETGILQAGAPWFLCPFGRDGLLAAWEALPLTPAPARGTLRLLARLQGRRTDPFTEEAPGKIPHELRRGELAGARLVPHVPYYGSVDATPLWVLCLGATCRWTGEASLAAELRPHLAAALGWCAGAGDPDGDGFIEYGPQHSPLGLAHQGWKDSWDGVVAPDGTVPDRPVALLEVQGYHYAALRAAASLYARLGQPGEASAARAAASGLARRFRARFWTPGDPLPALALDGRKRPLRTAASNAGHLLASGPLDRAESRSIAGRLAAPDFLSGWGVRTLAASEAAYDPGSYHNGSVWPHDTAIAAWGLRRRGYVDLAARVAADLLDACRLFPGGVIPELFSGRARQPQGQPEAVAGACTVQAWSSAAVFLALRALLGLRVGRGGLVVEDARLPRGVEELALGRMRVGAARVSLRFSRRGELVRCEVLEVDGPAEVTVRHGPPPGPSPAGSAGG